MAQSTTCCDTYQTTATTTKDDAASVANTASPITGGSSIAIGIRANSSSPTNAGDSIAIGTDVNATNQDSIAIGAQTTASGMNTIAIGNNGTTASGDNSNVFGISSIASGIGSNVFGNNATVNQDYGSAFGNGSSVTGIGGSAFGAASSASSDYATALGYGSIANRAGLNGSKEAFSNTAVSSPYGALSIGQPGYERQITNVAGGTQDTDAVNVRQLQAVGANTANALGGGAAYGTQANNYAYTPPSFAVGGQTYHDVADAMTASNNLAVQYTPDANGHPTNAVDLTKNGTIAATSITGLAPATTGSGAVSLSQLPLQYSTSGAPTTANPATASNDVTLIGTGGQPVTLHNVAPGALTSSSTDAVDGQQLYTTNQNLTALSGAFNTLTGGSTTPGVEYFHANSTGADSSATGTDAIAVGTGSSASGIRSIAIGVEAAAPGDYATTVGIGSSAQSQGSAFGEAATAGDTSLATGFRANASGMNSTALGGSTQAAGQYSLAAGTSASASGLSSTALGNDAKATGAQSVAIGGSGGTNSSNAAEALATNAVSIGYESTANNVGDVALGANSSTASAVATSGVTLGGTAYTFAGTTPSSTVSVGAPGAERTVTNVAAGRLSGTSTDAVNGSQLFATNQAFASLRDALDNGSVGLVQQNATTRGITVGAATDGTDVDFANSSGTQRTLSDVAAGQIAAGSTQAINGGQTYGIAASVAQGLGGGAAVNPNGTISAPSYSVQGTTYNNVGGAIGGLDTAINSIETGGSKYFAVDTTGGAATATGTDTVAIGPNAAATANQGVALGANSVASRAGLNGASEMFSDTSVASTAGAVSVGAAGAERQITNVAGGTQATDAVNVRQLQAVGDYTTSALGGGAGYNTSTNSYTAPSYSIDGKQYASVGSALSAVDNTSVKYDVDAVSGARTNSITLQGGDPDQPVLVKNVATGQAASDAANTGQVAAAKTQAMAYTDTSIATVEGQLGGVSNQLASLQSQVDQDRREARQGAAIGLAAASLRYDDRPGKLSTSIGGGVWKGEYASALGFGYSMPNGWARLSANGVTTGRDFGVGAGASFTLN